MSVTVSLASVNRVDPKLVNREGLELVSVVVTAVGIDREGPKLVSVTETQNTQMGL